MGGGCRRVELPSQQRKLDVSLILAVPCSTLYRGTARRFDDMLGITDDTRLSVLACRTRAYGGAVYAAWLDKITLDNSTFERNMVALLTDNINGRAYGSAVYATMTDLNLESCQLFGNTADDAGEHQVSSGAVYTVDVSDFRLSDCAFAQNIASRGAVSHIPFQWRLHAYGWSDRHL